METITFGGIEYHIPFRDLMPRHDSSQLASLRESIRADGVRVAIVITPSDPTGDVPANTVIDGANRLAIAAELGIAPSMVPTETRRCESMEQARALCETLNLERRHLTWEQQEAIRQRRREKIKRLRSEGKSTRAIAEEVGVSHVAVIKEEEKSGGNRLPPGRCEDREPGEGVEVPKTKGQDGKTYPAGRLTPEQRKARDDQIVDLYLRGHTVPTIIEKTSTSHGTIEAAIEQAVRDGRIKRRKSRRKRRSVIGDVVAQAKEKLGMVKQEEDKAQAQASDEDRRLFLAVLGVLEKFDSQASRRLRKTILAVARRLKVKVGEAD